MQALSAIAVTASDIDGLAKRVGEATKSATAPEVIYEAVAIFRMAASCDDRDAIALRAVAFYGAHAEATAVSLRAANQAGPCKDRSAIPPKSWVPWAVGIAALASLGVAVALARR